MASDRWKDGDAPAGDREGSREESGPSSPLPDFVRKALTAGFSGFFLTGEALREALGESVPKEWADFASEQSGRTRKEFIERLSFEMGRAIEGIDWAAVLATLLSGRTLEVNAQIRLAEPGPDGKQALRVELNEPD